MSVKSRRKVCKRGARVVNNETCDARIVVLAFSNDHRRAFVDGLTDELMAIGFLAPQRREQAVSLHSPRVIRDVFHWAIKWPDDLANWSRREKSLELHEVSASRDEAFNGARHWLRRFVPPSQSCGLALPAAVFRLAAREAPCESPHAAQDRDSGRPSPQDGKRSAMLQARRNSTPVCSCAHHRAPRDRQTRDAQPEDSRRKKRRTFPLHIRLEDRLSARFRFFQQW